MVGNSGHPDIDPGTWDCPGSSGLDPSSCWGSFASGDNGWTSVEAVDRNTLRVTLTSDATQKVMHSFDIKRTWPRQWSDKQVEGLLQATRQHRMALETRATPQERAVAMRKQLQERERVLGEPDTSVRNMARRIAHRKGIPFDPDRDLEAVAVF